MADLTTEMSSEASASLWDTILNLDVYGEMIPGYNSRDSSLARGLQSPIVPVLPLVTKQLNVSNLRVLLTTQCAF